MSFKSKGETLGEVPVDTGYTPSHPTGVRAVVNTEDVTGSIHNRSLLDIWNNLDLHDLSLRRVLPSPTFSQFTSTGDVTRGLSGEVYVGEGTSDNQTSTLLKYFRITDEYDRPLMVGRRPVLVTGVTDGSGSPSSVIGTSRQILSGTTNLTFSLQTITHASGPLGFGFVEVGDTVVVSGGTSNDGTYYIEEKISSLSVRVRTSSGDQAAFTSGTESGTITVSTPSNFTHVVDGTETFDCIVSVSAEIPASTVYRVHHFVAKRVEDFDRSSRNTLSVSPKFGRDNIMQDVYEGSSYLPRPRIPGGEGLTLYPYEGAMTVRGPVDSQDPHGSALRIGHASSSTGENNQAALVHEVVESLEGASSFSYASGKEYTALSVFSSKVNRVLDTSSPHDGSDLTDIGAGVVQSSSTADWAASGAVVGAQLVIGTRTDVYIITEVGPGGDTTRLRLDPTPTTWAGNEDFTLYSRVWNQETDKALIPHNTVGVLHLELPSGSSSGSVTNGSNILEDSGKDFSADGVISGDLVYCLDEDGNCVVTYEVDVVAPGGDVTMLQMVSDFIETNASLSYQVYDPSILNGRAFFLTNVEGSELEIQMLNGVSSSWSSNREGLSINFSDDLSIGDNFIEDSSGESLYQQGTHLSIIREGHTSSSVNEGYQSVSVLDHGNVSSARPYNADAIILPGDRSKGLTTSSSSNFVMIGDADDNYPELMGLKRGDVLIPLAGDDAGTELEITEVTSPYVTVSPTPNSDSNSNYPWPFYVKRSAFYVSPTGEMYANDYKYLNNQDRVYNISPFSIVQSGAPNASSGSYEDATGSGAYVWEAQSTSWGVFVPLAEGVKPGDSIKKVEYRVSLINSVSNPNTAISGALVYTSLDDSSSGATLSLATPYLSGNMSFTLDSRVVSYVPGGLASTVYPGCYVTLSGTGAWEVAEVLDDNNLVLSEDHGQATGTSAVVITNGKPVTPTPILPASEWLFVHCPLVYRDVSDGEIYGSELGGPDIGDKISGARIIYRGGRH